MKTIFVKPKDIERKWWLVDADGKTLGRLASRISTVLRGKHKPVYAPHMETGDYVVVVNAEKVKITGNKREQKVYYRHSGYPGGLKTTSLKDMMDKYPDRVVRQAVWGMLPHNRYGRHLLKRLRIYAGNDHPHQAQNPQRIG